MIRRLGAFFVFSALLLWTPGQARAATFGDTALTVGISSAVGAILGASTLPFYEDSGSHTKNIWIGAAVGAVVGVGFAAWSAVSEPKDWNFEDEYQEAEKTDFSYFEHYERPMRLTANLETRFRPLQPQQSEAPLWTKVYSVTF